ncbi:MAG: LysR family transcriptional regulator [Clostridia bacterium]|nr:LysR family transcriptional regulator [Clostridia bacterium]
MNIRQLQYAVELSRTLNFSQVAARLGITQPALSKQIRSLEEEIGVRLFDRSTTPLTLTAAGEHFIRKAEGMLYQEEQLLRSMEEFKEGKRGRLTVGISPFRALYLMPRVAKALTEAYPDVHLVLCEAGSETLRKEAAEGKYDFAIVNLPVDETLLDVIPLESDQLVLAVPNELLPRLGKQREDAPLPLSACKELDFVLVSQAQELRRLFEKRCEHEGFHPRVKTEVVGLSTAWEMCRAGVGATLLPLQYIQKAGTDEGVTLFPPAREMRSRQPVIVTRRGAYLSEYARFAIDRLLEEQNG